MAKDITLGQKLRTLETQSVVLTETLHPAGLELEAHDHDNANVNFVLSGTFSERVEHRDFDCDRGTLLVKPAGAAHSNNYGSQPTRCLVAEFRPKLAAEILCGSHLLEDVWYRKAGPFVNLGWQLYRETCYPDSSTEVVVTALILQLFGEGARHRERAERGTRAPLWLRRIRERLETGYFRDIEVEDLSREAQVHPAHLMRAFQRYYGCSVGEYVRQKRILEAQRRLSETRFSIAEIAIEAGFYDQSHFTRTFKRVTGFTPAEYRSLSGLLVHKA